MRSKDRSGFTILELLIAATITIVIVVLLGAAFGSLAKISSRTNNSIDAFRDARAAMHMMERDLSATVAARPAAYFVIDADEAGTSGAAVCQIEALVSAKNQPVAVGGATPAPGDLCAVRYYCAWDTNAKTYTMNRFFRDSKSTQTMLYTLYKSNGYVDLMNLYRTAATADEPLASYVWGLRATAYDPTGNVIGYTKDSAGYQATGAPHIWDGSPTPAPNPLPSVTPTPTPRPAAVEISFRAMSPTAAKAALAVIGNRSDAYNVWMAADNGTAAKQNDLNLYNQLIAPNTYVFRTRIVFH